MPVVKVEINQFLQLAAQYPVLDVRSPGEYQHAHIPGASNLPLFSNEERKEVGTAYKQQSREAAIKIGLDFFGPKMRPLVEEAEAIAAQYNNTRTLLVHCWRGGMRSGAIAWLLDLYGFKVYTLTGGYKYYRRLVLQQFERKWPFRVLGGYTGSGKTELLHRLQQQGHPVIDLEAIAGHKGSAFGAIGLPPQPTQEMFENLLATALMALPQDAVAWVEDESQRIGLVNIPINFWNHTRTCPVYFLDPPFEARLKHVTDGYGQLDRDRMRDAITRIKKRLGGLETKTALQYLEEENIQACFRILLKYYDKYYLRGLKGRENWQQLMHTIPAATTDAAAAIPLIEALVAAEEAAVQPSHHQPT